MKRRITIFLIVFIGLIWLGGFLSFLSNVPHRRPADDLHVDAVVVFTGPENMRTRQSVEAYRAGIAPRLLISGVSPSVTKVRLLRWLYLHPPGNLKMDFTLGYQAANTIGNAEETAAWACANNVHSIRLTTADYHMPRSLYLLHQAWPDAVVIPDPLLAPYGHKNKRILYNIWGLWQSLVEYHKLTVQRLRIMAGTLSVPVYQCIPQKDLDTDD